MRTWSSTGMAIWAIAATMLNTLSTEAIRNLLITINVNVIFYQFKITFIYCILLYNFI